MLNTSARRGASLKRLRACTYSVTRLSKVWRPRARKDIDRINGGAWARQSTPALGELLPKRSARLDGAGTCAPARMFQPSPAAALPRVSGTDAESRALLETAGSGQSPDQ